MDPASPFLRRSDRTRAAILQAAQDLFAREGFERTTIRAVAAAARIDPSMVMRYFGDKDGLFAAASAVDLRMPDLTRVPREELGRALMAHFFARWENDPGLHALLRSAANNSEVAAKARGIFMQQLRPVVEQLSPDQPERRAGLLVTQALGLALCRYVLKLPGVWDAPPDRLIEDMAPTVARYVLAEL
jgi:AcrR family transcriptional regulator